MSHLSLDALHREQDRVYLRRLDFESEEALALFIPSFAVLSILVGGILDVLYVCIAPRAPYGCHSVSAGEERQGRTRTYPTASSEVHIFLLLPQHQPSLTTTRLHSYPSKHRSAY